MPGASTAAQSTITNNGTLENILILLLAISAFIYVKFTECHYTLYFKKST